ncbi:MAG: UvrD-helicase domain-containing protein [Planctomycetota bacterium]
MQYALDSTLGKVVHVRQVEGAAAGGSAGAIGAAGAVGAASLYRCPRCLKPLRLVHGRGQKPHFEHAAGGYDPACELFLPDLPPETAAAPPTAAAVDAADGSESAGQESDAAAEGEPALGEDGRENGRENGRGDGREDGRAEAGDPWETDPLPVGLRGGHAPEAQEAQDASDASDASNALEATAAGTEDFAAEQDAEMDEPADLWEASGVPLDAATAAKTRSGNAAAARDADAAARDATPAPATDMSARPEGGWSNDPAWGASWEAEDDPYAPAARARDLAATGPDQPLGAPDFLFEDLNPRQREAVEALDGPVLVVAGAGSGKTRVITRRIAHLLVRGVAPWRIIALTFTNKAAGEMRRRVESLILERGWSVPAHEIWMSTFNSSCARILRREAHHLGLERSFSIYDEDDANALIKQIIEAANRQVDSADFRRPSTVRRLISDVKNGSKALADFDFHASGRVFVEMFDSYNKALRANNAVDFDDLLLLVVKLFNDHSAVRESYARRFRYVLIDEFQDTNPIQYEIVKALCSVHRNICATGDPDQSIYGWRGADIRNILNFEHDFPDTRQIVLDQNYRSTQKILDAASTMIGNNRERKEKRLYSELGDGAEPVVLETADETAEAGAIVAGIEAHRRGGGRYRDCAVFYRINAQSGPIEQALVQAGAPYTIVGGTAFYQRKEVKDALAYLRLAANPSDDISFQRVVNWPRRKIGPGALSDLETLAKQLGQPLLPTLRSAEAPKLLGKRHASFAGFVGLIDRIAGRGAAGAKPGSLADTVTVAVHDTGLIKEYAKDDRNEMRVENLAELVNAAARYDQARRGQGTLVGFLENVALVSQVDRWDSDSDHVTLMTLHMAKGLEFPQVWIAGLEEGLFPLIRGEEDIDDPRAIEEERRLMYVGITRAQRALTMVHARQRMRYGRRVEARASRFLDELPADGVRYVRSEPPRRADWSGQDGWRLSAETPLLPTRSLRAGDRADERADERGTGESGRWGSVSSGKPAGGVANPGEDDFGRTVEWEDEADLPAAAQKRRPMQGSGNLGQADNLSRSGGERDFALEEAAADLPLAFDELAVGLRVRHRQYRTGAILAVEEAGAHHPKVVIRFDKYGEKEFSGRRVELWRE